MAYDIRRDADASQYVLSVGGEEVGELAYRDAEGARAFTHTRVDETHQEDGLGTALVERALHDTRDEGLRIVPECPFVAQFVSDHAEWQQLVISSQGS